MNYVYEGASLEGYIAGPNGEIDWLEERSHPDDGDHGFAEFMAGVDALLMGRNSFDVEAGMDEWYYDKPVRFDHVNTVVFQSSLVRYHYRKRS